VGNADLAKISFIYIVVEGDNKTGTLEINRWPVSTYLAPSLLTQSAISVPSTGLTDLGITAIAPDTNQIDLTLTGRGLRLTYNTEAPAGSAMENKDGWVAAGFTYDDLMNTPNPPYEWRSLKDGSGDPLTLVFGIKNIQGTLGPIKFEVIDYSGNKSGIYLDGIMLGDEKIYQIDLSGLQGTADLEKVSYMYFVVEGQNKQGIIEINRWPEAVFVSPSSLNEGNISLPGTPGVMGVAPYKDQITVSQTGRGLQVSYKTETSGVDHTSQNPNIELDGWAGAGFTYDDLSTPTKEYYNFNAVSQIVIGLKNTAGDNQRVKIEVVDASGNKSALYLDGLTLNQEKIYAVDLSRLKGNVDFSRVSYIFFVVEGHNKTGTIQVNRLASSSLIMPSTTHTSQDINLPSGGLFYPDVVNVPDNGVTSQAEIISRGMTFEYNTNIAMDSVANYTTPTNIALSMTEWLLVAKGDLQVSGVSQDDALNMLSKSINAVYNIPDTQKWHGFYYVYDFSTDTYGDVISQADNGNLAAAFAAIIGALQNEVIGNPVKQDIVNKASAILNEMDWTKFINPAANIMYTALDINKSTGVGTPQGFPDGTPYYVDNIFDEFRLGVMFGIVQNDVDQAAWTNMSKNIATFMIDNGLNLTTLKSGNGAMFQAFLPSIFFKESDWSKNADGSLNGFGVALKNFALIQDYVARTEGSAGLFSAAMNPAADGLYQEFGVPDLALYPASQNASAPYASALAYLSDPSLAMTWLNSLYIIGADTPYGFRDSITADGVMANRMLVLDDGMIVLALQGSTVGNYVENYFNSIGKLQIVKDLYKNTLTLSDQTGAATPLTSAQETLRDSIAVEHFNAFKNIADAQTGWVYDHFNIHSGWAGAGFSYDNGVDLNASGEQNIIIGIKGGSPRVKFEVVDDSDNKAFVYLDGISSTEESIYAIPLSMLKNVNLGNIKAMYFIVEGENMVGTLEINRTSLPMVISASGTLTVQDINIPGSGVGYPGMEQLINVTTLGATDRGMQIVYNIPAVPVPADQNWAGAGFDYTNLVDLTSYSQLVFGLKGNGDINGRIKFEIKDASNNSRSIYLDGIDLNTEKVWSIPTAYLQGIDLAHVRHMFFIVEGNNTAGTLYVNRVKSSQWIPPTTIIPEPAPNLPTTNSNAYAVASLPAAAAITSSSANHFTLSYNTSTAGWAGASFAYNPTINMMSGFDRLVFRMSGSASRIKFEIKDSIGGEYSLFLNGIIGTSQTWDIQKSLISGIDWTSIKEFNFIIEGLNQSGTLDVTVNP